MDNSPEENKPPVLYELAPSGVARHRWWGHLIILTVYPLAVGLLSWVAGPSAGPALGRGGSRLLLLFTVELALFGVIFGVAWLLSRANRDQLLLRWHGGAAFVLLGVAYSVALRLLVAAFIAAIVVFLLATGSMEPRGLQDFFTRHRPSVESLVDITALRDDPVYFVLTITVVSFVLGGLREELWRSGVLAGMRALWPATLGSRLGQMVPVLLAAAVFGVGHLGQGPFAVLLTAVLGLGLGVIMVVHKSIWPAVIAHGMFNATSMALLPWAMEHARP